MNFARLFGEQGVRTVALFDIGSGSVGGAIATLEPDQTPTVHVSIRTPLPFQETPDRTRLKKEMKTAVSSTAAGLHKEYAKLRASGASLKNISHVYVTLATQWYVSRTHLIKLSREETFTVSRHFLDDLLAEAKKRFTKVAAEELSEDGMLVRLEESIVQTVLNGYPTSEPHGKKAHRLDAAVYLSLVGAEVKEGILQALTREFSITDITLHSYLLTAYLIARDLHPTVDDFLLIDISGEATDIGLVRDGVLLESVSFSWGRNHVLRVLARELGTIPEEAHTLLRIQDKQPADERILKAKETVRNEWVKALEGACAELAKDERLPKHVFLTTLPDLTDWFSDAIRADACSRYTFTREPFEAHILGGKDIGGHYALRKGIAFDPFLVLEAVHFNRVEFS